jgi:hypothetical protein
MYGTVSVYSNERFAYYDSFTKYENVYEYWSKAIAKFFEKMLGFHIGVYSPLLGTNLLKFSTTFPCAFASNFYVNGFEIHVKNLAITFFRGH